MSERLRQLQEKRAAQYAEILDMRKQFDGKEMDAEKRAAWEKMVSDCNELDRQIDAEKKFLEMEARSAREKSEQRQQQTDSKAEVRAFAKYLLGAQLDNNESALLKRSIPGMAGDVIIPSSIASYIEKALAGRSGMLSVVNIIRTTTGGDLVIPTINDAANRAEIVAEYGESSEETVTFSSVTLKAHTYRTPIVPISLELLQDSAFNLEQFIGELLADRYVAGLTEDFTNGSGTDMPQGIVTAAKKVTPAGEGIIYDDMLALRKGVGSQYLANASYMMNTATECDLMLMKDGNDRPLWLPSMRDGAPATILGRPVVINDRMKGSDIVFGDLKKYDARIVKDFTVSVLRELYAKYLSVGVMGFGRADGKLIDAGTNPIAVLKK